MTINDLWNKRCGPGGGTRRLHHVYGDETGSTCVIKISFSFGVLRRYRANLIDANSNVASAKFNAPANSNNFAAVSAAA